LFQHRPISGLPRVATPPCSWTFMTTTNSKVKENARLGYWRRQFRKRYKALVVKFVGVATSLQKTQENELGYALRIDELTRCVVSSQGELVKSSMLFLTMQHKTQVETKKTIDQLISLNEETYKENRSLKVNTKEMGNQLEKFRVELQEKEVVLKVVKDKAKEKFAKKMKEKEKELEAVGLKARLAEERLDRVKSKARETVNELKKAKRKGDIRESVVTDTGKAPAKSEARERVSEPDKAETVIGKEAARREARLEIEVPTKETYRVTRVISKDEVPFKKFRYTTNYEPRRLASYVSLMTKFVKTADQWRHYENTIAERALMGDDALLERDGVSLEDEETVESGEQQDDTDDDSDDQDGNDRGEQHAHDSGEHDDTDENSDQEYSFEHYHMDGKIDSDNYHNDTDNDSDNYIDKDSDDEDSDY